MSDYRVKGIQVNYQWYNSLLCGNNRSFTKRLVFVTNISRTTYGSKCIS